MQLTKTEIEQLFTYIFEDLNDKNIGKIAFQDEDDYYFKVRHEDRRFNSKQFLKCPTYVIGSLDDDITWFKRVLEDEVITSVDLEHLGAVLTAWGRTMNKKDSVKTDKPIKLSLNDLKHLFRCVLQKLDNCEISEIAFDEDDDLYCKIQHKDKWFEDEKFLDCPPYTIESVSADMAKLKEVIDGKRPLSNLDYERLGAVLTTLGATING